MKKAVQQLMLGKVIRNEEQTADVLEKIAFAGYDCIPLTQTLEPRLTTIRQSADEMGKIAAQMLIELVKNGQQVADVIYFTE